ncbi:hypothetical protein WG924_02090 [Tistrella sp. 25B02-3]
MHGLDRRQLIALRIAIKSPPAGKVDADSDRAVGVGDSIDAVTAFQKIRAATPAQNVVALKSTQGLGPRRSGKHIAMPAAMNDLNAREPVALGIAAGSGAGREVDPHTRAGVGIGHGVDAGTTLQQIGATTPAQNIVAIEAAQCLCAGTTRQDIISGAAMNRLDRGQPIALRVTIHADASFQIHPNTNRAVGVAGDVDPIAALQQIGATAPA